MSLLTDAKMPSLKDKIELTGKQKDEETKIAEESEGLDIPEIKKRGRKKGRKTETKDE